MKRSMILVELRKNHMDDIARNRSVCKLISRIQTAGYVQCFSGNPKFGTIVQTAAIRLSEILETDTVKSLRISAPKISAPICLLFKFKNSVDNFYVYAEDCQLNRDLIDDFFIELDEHEWVVFDE